MAKRKKKITRSGQETPEPVRKGLRVTDQETARVVAVFDTTGKIAGAGCLVTEKHILTCFHVIEAALGAPPRLNDLLTVKLIGVLKQPTAKAQVIKLGNDDLTSDLALLEITDDLQLGIAPVEFAAPLRHGGKKFSVLGFPNDFRQGRNVSGFLHGADAADLVQMDSSSPLMVERGFSGAPVWSPDLDAFVGLVVVEHSAVKVAWCIPSRLLCAFYNDLRVRFRIPPSDRPRIHDYWEDDPNVQLFGTTSNNGERRLTASIKEKAKYYSVKVVYERISGPPLRGGYVTFITYPDFEHEDQDGYELFSKVNDVKAETEIYPSYAFTVAAIGDGGDTALTIDLSKLKGKPKAFK